MLIQIDTDRIEEIFPILYSLGYEGGGKRRFWRGLPPPYGDGVEITDQMRFLPNGDPVFPPRDRP